MNQETPTLVETLSVLSRRLRQLISEIYSDNLGLSESAASLLKALTQEEFEPKWTQSKLAKELSLSESSLCTLVERLRQEHYLDRERLVVDRRKTQIRLTEKGFRTVDEIYLIEQEFEEKFWNYLSGSEGKEVSAVLENVAEACDECRRENDTDRSAA